MMVCYILIGILCMILIEEFNKQEDKGSFTHSLGLRLGSLIFWPVILYDFIYHFIKEYRNRNND